MSQDLLSYIISWLNDLPTTLRPTSVSGTSTSSTFLHCKRKRLGYPLSPPDSPTLFVAVAPVPGPTRMTDAGAEPLAKRIRANTGASSYEGNALSRSSSVVSSPLDLEATPRPKLTAKGSRRSYATSSTSSPTKQQVNLEYAAHPTAFLSFANLSRHNGLVGLSDMLAKMTRFSRGRAILSPNWSLPTNDTLDANISLPVDPEDMQLAIDHTGERESIGAVPSPSVVHAIVENTRVCQDNQHYEASWCLEVYSRVFDAALRPHSGSLLEDGFINYRYCASSSIKAKYAASLAKMVDFCIVLDLSAAAKAMDNQTEQALSRLKQLDPIDHSINHSSDPSLRKDPICISVECKKSGHNYEGSKLQLGVWLDAQLRHLEYLSTLHHDADACSPPQGDLIEFLPSILIQGDEWYFTAATRSSNTTMFWSRQSIGSTSTPLGVYQIICAVQYLAHWAKKVYWPWFQRTVLGLQAPL
ncbi:hypothetical protein MKZ38_010281 [Zalerion maritima]|uniref:PD-(D/E)XK nuclease-like domain-containing protein n=1 Tax=Zalerion maritima TaxID=339359 RepID=A0AAD5WMW9_9PEZI|nr:hypothetical protein MKZ38_010281 [Zalerion maritima]